MTRVLVTGGTGVLGSELVKRIREKGHITRVMSRRPAPASLPALTEWAQVDMAKGEGLADAVKDVQVIYHAASSPFRQMKQVDIEGTRQLLEIARREQVAHFIYISIVGIDRIPFSYYKIKLATEKVIAESGVPWTTLRTTQFHNFIDMLLGASARLPVMLLPTDFQDQPVDVTEVAARMVDLVDQAPAGRLPDMGGPEVLRLGDMARVWLRSQQMKRPIVHLPLWGETVKGFRNGYHTTSNGSTGTLRWSEWLESTYGKREQSDERIFQS